MTVLRGSTVTLRPATPADVFALVTIRATPQVRERWGGADDLAAEILDDIARGEEADRIVGAIQWQASEDPIYRHAGIDLYLDPAVHGRGLCTDAVRFSPSVGRRPRIGEKCTPPCPLLVPQLTFATDHAARSGRSGYTSSIVTSAW